MATSSTNACIFYHPRGGPLRVVNLGGPLDDISARRVVEQTQHKAISGRRQSVVYSSRWLVDVKMSLIVDEDIVAEVEAVVNHLQAGGAIAVAEVGARTLGAFLRVAPARGATNLNWFTQLYSAYGNTWTPTVGDRLLLRGPSPRCLREDPECASGGSASGANLAVPTRHDWRDQPWVFVHDRGFWPGLVLQEQAFNRDLFPHEHRIHWTLNLPLEEPEHLLEGLAQAPEQPLGGEIEKNNTPKLDDYISLESDKPGTRKPKSGPLGKAPGGKLGWWR